MWSESCWPSRPCQRAGETESKANDQWVAGQIEIDVINGSGRIETEQTAVVWVEIDAKKSLGTFYGPYLPTSGHYKPNGSSSLENSSAVAMR